MISGGISAGVDWIMADYFTVLLHSPNSRQICLLLGLCTEYFWKLHKNPHWSAMHCSSHRMHCGCRHPYICIDKTVAQCVPPASLKQDTSMCGLCRSLGLCQYYTSQISLNCTPISPRGPSHKASFLYLFIFIWNSAYCNSVYSCEIITNICTSSDSPTHRRV